MTRPLHGAKTHPLSKHALARLADIGEAPVPTFSVNPGVGNRLIRENLVRIVRLPSPFKLDHGKPRDHYQITAAGRERLAREEAK